MRIPLFPTPFYGKFKILSRFVDFSTISWWKEMLLGSSYHLIMFAKWKFPLQESPSFDMPTYLPQHQQRAARRPGAAVLIQVLNEERKEFQAIAHP